MSAMYGLRVLDLGEEISAYCTRVLASLGAEVVLIEPPGGGAARGRLPLREDIAAPEGSLHFAHFNAGKRSVVMDLELQRERVLELAAGADVVVESHPVGQLAALGLGFEELRAAHPGLVLTSISPYGQSGPKRHWPGTDLTAAASSGLLYITGEPSNPPTQYGGEQVSHLAALYAAAGTLAAVRSSRKNGRGAHVDIALQQAAHSITGDRQLGVIHTLTGIDPRRTGNQTPHFFPYRNYPCADGWVTICALEPDQWAKLSVWVAAVTGNQLVLDPRFAGRGADRAPLAAELTPIIEAFALALTKSELMEGGQERRIPIMCVSTIVDLLANPQLVARSFFNTIEHPRLGTSSQPRPPYRFSATPSADASPAPLLGEHEAPQWLRAATREAKAGDGALPLAGLRVVELGWYVAAPWVGLVLGRLGAEVIKVETSKRIDVMRTLPIVAGEPTGADYSAFGGGKLSITLDVRTEAGRNLCRRLIAVSDVFVENFSTSAIRRFGLEYDDVRAVNPQIIMARMPGLGLEGPYSGFVSYGLALQALSGLDELTGFPEGPPGGSSVSYPDYIAALHGAVAILAALEHRDRTGEGQMVEVAQLEAAVTILGPAFFEHATTGYSPGRMGNAHATYAPHGVYRCAGEDAWVAVAVASEPQWLALADVLGLADDDAACDAAARRTRRQEIDATIEQWTASRSGGEVEELLASAGVPAAAVATAGDVLADPQLRALGYFHELVDPEYGPLPFGGSPIRIDGAAAPPAVAHPLGADNELVFCELLGLSAHELSHLIATEVIQ
jgi:crotonobetainyl-CoA:carnitine CoA-transferase CaiB-like acyl-CoA transferase